MTALSPMAWAPMRPIAPQIASNRSRARFVVVVAGRRSGKSVLARRKLVRRAVAAPPGSRFFAAAPTWQQAKRLHWDALKQLVPAVMLRGSPSESELVIRLVTDVEIHVFGMDKPARMEGSPWDGGLLDEYADMKATAWPRHVRPALSDRLGWCHFLGVPEGRNHFYDLFRAAREYQAKHPGGTDWDAYHWVSAEVLPQDEVEAARRDLDELTFQQEYGASFVSFEGRAYYVFSEAKHAGQRLEYVNDPQVPLCFAFDFNVAPGAAVVLQEIPVDPENDPGRTCTRVIGQVHIPRGSNTPAVCAKLAADWGQHRGPVRIYGDASGGNPSSSQTQGSDWDLVAQELGRIFGGRLSWRVPQANPPVRARVNAVNSRLLSATGEVRLYVDPVTAPEVVRDLDGVRLLEGGSGEIDKRHDPKRTHWSDALGYYLHYEFPVEAAGRVVTRQLDMV